MSIQYFLAPKPLTKNHISCSKSALKLTYSNVEFQNFPGEDPRTPRFKGRGREWDRGEVAPWALGGMDAPDSTWDFHNKLTWVTRVGLMDNSVSCQCRNIEIAERVLVWVHRYRSVHSS
jgi:hypothetical protein